MQARISIVLATVTCGGIGAGTSDSTSIIFVSVVDDEPLPTVIAPSSVEVAETNASQFFTIPITFAPPFRNPPSVSASLIYHSATAKDVVMTNGYAGDGVIKLTILGDELPEADETAGIYVAGAEPKVIALTILDDDRPPFPFAFDQTNYVFREDEPMAVTVLRSGSLSESVELTLEIRFVPEVLWRSIPFVFAPGEDAKVIDLPSFDDAEYTGERQASLELLRAGWLGTRVPLFIQDDETKPPKPVLSIGDGSVLEGNLDAHTRLEIPVTLSAALPTPISVNVTATHGTTSLDDVVLAPQVVQIPAGERTGIAAFDVIGDIDLEQDETFQVTLATCCAGLVTMGRSTGTGTILNDDVALTEAVYWLAFTNTRFSDADRWLTVPIKRLGRIDLPTRVTVVLTSSDARVFAPRKVWFAPYETQKEARFYIYDNFYSGNADVRVDLLDDSRLVQSATVQIIESVQLGIVVFGASAREGVDASVRFRVQIGRRSTPLTLHLRASPGTARIPYDLPAYDETVTIPPFTASYTVDVPINDDREPEESEQFLFEVFNIAGVRIKEATGTILDNDSVYVAGDWSATVGTVASFTVEFQIPAPSQDIVEILLAPDILDGPPTVVVPKGASNVTFEAPVRHAGTIWVRINPPKFLHAPIISTLFVARDAPIAKHDPVPDWTLDPDTMQVAPGEMAEIALPFELDSSEAFFSSTFLMESSDPRIADASPGWTGNRYDAVVYGVHPGRTDIRITRDGTTRTLSVVVVDPPEPYPRKHSVRH